jgi:hypothetical protein
MSNPNVGIVLAGEYVAGDKITITYSQPFAAGETAAAGLEVIMPNNESTTMDGMTLSRDGENDCYSTEFVNQLAVPSHLAYFGQKYLLVFAWLFYWRFWNDCIFPVYRHTLANVGHYDLGDHQWAYDVYRT